MTDLEVLKSSIDTLDRLSIPAQYTEQISIPVYNVSNMLKKLYEAIVVQLKKQEEDKAVAEEPPKEE